MITKPICIAGDGWGAISAYKGLIEVFNAIDVLTNDPDLKNIIKDNHNIINDFEDSDSVVVICSGYRPIIRKSQFIKRTFINIHPSLLPGYRGQHSTVWAILNDEKELGVTIHLMNDYIDDGPIIFQHSVPNDFKSSSVYYMEVFNSWVEENLGKVLVKYMKGDITPKIQNKNLATWVGKRTKKDCKIDFSKDHRYLKNFFRALVPPYPLPYIELAKDHTEFSIVEASFIERKIVTHIGRILNIDNEGLYVSSKDGYVILNHILDLNNKVVDINNFKIGTFLNQDFR